MRKKFRYYLRAANGDYYYVSGGNVLTTSTPTPLVTDIMEWREVDLRWVRNSKYHGIFRSFIIPLSFVNEGATILRHIFYTQEGIESECTLYIEKQKAKTSSTAGDETYQFYYSGAIDFSQKHDALHYFQVEVLDSGLAALIKAKERTPYEIYISSANALNVYHNGLRLKNTSVLQLANEPLASNSWHQMMPMITIQHNESDIQVDVIEQANQQGLGTSAIIQDHPFFEATIAGTVVIDYDITMQLANSAGSSLGAHSFQALIVKYDGSTSTPLTPLINIPSFTNYIGPVLHAVGTVSVAVNPGDTLAFFAGLSPFNLSSGADAFLVDHTYFYSTLSVHYDLQLPDTVYRARRYHDVAEDLVNSLTDGAYGFRSDFLSNTSLSVKDSRPWHTLLTSGDALRRLDWTTGFWAGFLGLVGTRIKTTLEELHNDATARWMTGIGVENDSNGDPIVRLERLSYFYDDATIIADVGEVKDLQVDVALDYIYNLLKVGTAPYDYDGLNGKDEPNTTSVFDLPIIRKPAEWDMITPYRDDMYGVEFTRANLVDKKTTDSKSDNDTFAIEIASSATAVTVPNPNGYTGAAFPLYRPQNNLGNSVSGLIAGERAFNLTHSPKRKLLRNGAILYTALHQQDSKVIKFQTSDKNPELSSNLGSGTVTENADINVSALDAPLFLPILFTFETEVPTDLPDLIATNPYGKIQFTYRGNTYSGFIDEVGIKPANNAVYTWKLLASPTTNLATLIH